MGCDCVKFITKFYWSFVLLAYNDMLIAPFCNMANRIVHVRQQHIFLSLTLSKVNNTFILPAVLVHILESTIGPDPGWSQGYCLSMC